MVRKVRDYYQGSLLPYGAGSNTSVLSIESQINTGRKKQLTKLQNNYHIINHYIMWIKCKTTKLM